MLKNTEQVKRILNDPKKIEQMRTNTSKIAKRNSTKDICEIIMRKSLEEK